MSVTNLSDEELERVRKRYLAADKQEGGPFTLREVLLEQLRRKPSAFGVVETARKIIELAAQSKDGLVTYGDLWKAFCPGVQWKANYSRRVVADASMIPGRCVGAARSACPHRRVWWWRLWADRRLDEE